MNEALKQLNEIAEKIDLEKFYVITIEINYSRNNDIRFQGNYNHEYISNLLEKFDGAESKINDAGFTEIVVDNLKFVFT